MERDGGTVTASAIAGASAGVVAAVFVCPLDVIKTRLQAQAGAGTASASNGALGRRAVGGSVYACTSSLLRTEGIRGLYRGLQPTVLALLPNWAVRCGIISSPHTPRFGASNIGYPANY